MTTIESTPPVITGGKITIDLNEWCTPRELAESFGVTKQVVNNWVRRGKVTRVFVSQLGCVLVKVNHDKFNKRKKE